MSRNLPRSRDPAAVSRGATEHPRKVRHERRGCGSGPGGVANPTILFRTDHAPGRHGRIAVFLRCDELEGALEYSGNLRLSTDGGATWKDPYRRRTVKARDDDANTLVEIDMGQVRKGVKVSYRIRPHDECPGTWVSQSGAGWSAALDPTDTEQPPDVTGLTLDVDEHRAQLSWSLPADTLDPNVPDMRIALLDVELWRDALDTGTLVHRDRYHHGERKSFRLSKPGSATFFARVSTVSSSGVRSTGASTSATKNTPSTPAAPTVVFTGSRNRTAKVTPATVAPTDAEIDLHVIELVTMPTHVEPSGGEDGDLKRVDADPTTGAPERAARFTKLPGGEWVYVRTRVKDTQRRRSAFSPWTDAGQAGADDDTPVGVIRKWSGGAGSIPSGYLLCNGQAVSRTTYGYLNALYAADGYPYGAGNGSTTFNVPDLRRRHARGVGTGQTLGENDGVAEASRDNDHEAHGAHPTHGAHGAHDSHGAHGGHNTHVVSHGAHNEHETHDYGGHTHNAGTLTMGNPDDTVLRTTTGSATASSIHKHTITGDTGSTGSNHGQEHDALAGRYVRGHQVHGTDATHGGLHGSGDKHDYLEDALGHGTHGTHGAHTEHGTYEHDRLVAGSYKGHGRHPYIRLHFIVKT